MMTEYRDQVLESLFDEANRELEGEVITARVMARTRNRLVKMAASAISLTLVVLLLSWYVFAIPLLEFAVMVSQFITNPLVELGEGWLALAFLPVNNIASLSVLAAKLSLMAWKKLTGTTLVR